MLTTGYPSGVATLAPFEGLPNPDRLCASALLDEPRPTRTTALTISLSQEPDSPLQWMAFCQHYLRNQEHEALLAILSDMVKLPEVEQSDVGQLLLYYIAHCHYQQNRYHDTRDAIKRLLRALPPSMTHTPAQRSILSFALLLQANVHRRKGEYREALVFNNSALAYADNSAFQDRVSAHEGHILLEQFRNGSWNYYYDAVNLLQPLLDRGSTYAGCVLLFLYEIAVHKSPCLRQRLAPNVHRVYHAVRSCSTNSPCSKLPDASRIARSFCN